MPANKNRLRARDERISIVLKVLLGLMTGAILLLLIGFVVVYSSSWIVPPSVTVPEMIGKPVGEVQALADKLKIRLILHGSYSDKARNIVYKTDQPRGVQLQAKHAVNVWYSKGPEYVNVPDVVGIEKEQAEQKLKDAGLTVGKVMPEYSKKVPRNAVISQNVSYKKRVLHDTAVDLMFSDGPQPDFSDGQTTDNPEGNTPDNSSSGQDGAAANSGANPGPAQNGSDPNAAPVDDTQHEFNRTITIPKDHKGSRQVRIEMIDQHVENDHLDPVVLIDEGHDEGDKIPLIFQYHGKYITLRIFYDNGPTPIWSRRFDPSDTKNKGRIN
jgi:serine/threonine-protein kinase